VDCGNVVAAKPASITIACGDGNVVAARLQWSEWTSARATGTGVVDVNDCSPDCASGSVQGYPALVGLTDRQAVDGKQAFTVLTATYTGARPFDGTPPYGSRTERYHLVGNGR
jgi:hypothetical protein